MMLSVLNVVGACLGIIGAILVACRFPRTGMKLWLIANPLIIIYNVLVENMWGVAMFSVYTITTILGILNWKEFKEGKHS